MLSKGLFSPLGPLSAISLGVLFALASASAAGAQSFSRTFSVSPESVWLEVTNQIGSIKVTAASTNTNKVVVNARQVDGDARTIATQTSDGKVKVEVNGRGTVDLDINVPPSTKVNLYTYKGAISVVNLTGPVRARITTEGNIQLTGLRSSEVFAHSISGNVVFNGDVIPDGDYTLKSFSGRVDVTFPPNANFRLSASSIGGVMDLGGFPMKFDRQTDQLVEAACGNGRAKVFLWTQEGSIHLHRKP
jgi:Putative adhesin